MSAPALHMVETTLKVLTFPKVGEALANLPCPDCGSRLDLHQPESQYPDRMLGTCQKCHRWFVADFVTNREDGVIVFLPDAKYFLSRS